MQGLHLNRGWRESSSRRAKIIACELVPKETFRSNSARGRPSLSNSTRRVPPGVGIVGLFLPRPRGIGRTRPSRDNNMSVKMISWTP